MKAVVKTLALGALLAALFWAARGPPRADTDRPEILVTEAEVAHIGAGWQRTWSTTPGSEELKKAVDAYVRNEILYREALARGMDREDPRVRTALIQKMQMLTVGQADAQEVTGEDLAAFYALRKDRYKIPAEISLFQVLFKTGTNAQARAEALRARFREKEPSAETLREAGDPSLIDPLHTGITARDLEETFGTDFAAEVLSLPSDTWSGPVRSSYGLHVVKVFDRVPGRIPELAEVRAKVENDLRYEAATALEEQGFQEIVGKYRITITEGAERMLQGEAVTATTDPGDGK